MDQPVYMDLDTFNGLRMIHNTGGQLQQQQSQSHILSYQSQYLIQSQSAQQLQQVFYLNNPRNRIQQQQQIVLNHNMTQQIQTTVRTTWKFLCLLMITFHLITFSQLVHHQQFIHQPTPQSMLTIYPNQVRKAKQSQP